MMLKNLKYKSLYLFTAVVFLLLVFKDILHDLFFFDTTAPDLLNNGQKIKEAFLLNNMSLEIGLFNLGFYTSFVMPIVSVIILFDYKLNRHCYVKHFIGKKLSYAKQLAKLKNVMGLIGVGIYLTVFFIVIISSVVVNKTEISPNFYQHLFNANSLMANVISNQWLYLMFLGTVVSIAIYVNIQLICLLMDKLDNFILVTMLYLGFIWLGSLALYSMAPFYVVPMTTYMLATYGNYSLLTLCCPYISYLLVYGLLKKGMPNEIQTAEVFK